MTGRQLFAESEKMMLQDLVLKYNLNKTHSQEPGFIATKKLRWAKLVTEFNAKRINVVRTEAQLRKCWDNMKTRRKSAMIQEQAERMKAAAKNACNTLVVEPNLELYSIDSSTSETPAQGREVQIKIEEEEQSDATDVDPVPFHTVLEEEWIEEPTQPAEPKKSSEKPRAKVRFFNNLDIREEELHKFRIAEMEWRVKTAEEQYNKARLEKELAEQQLKNSKEEHNAEYHSPNISESNIDNLI